MRRALALAALVGCAHAAVSDPAALPADAIRALPAASRHVFVAPDAVWVPHVSYQRLRPDAFVTIPDAEIGDARDLYKETRYVDAGGALRKLVRRFPDGEVAYELDVVADESFARRFYASGAFASYLHCRVVGGFEHCIAGYSESPTRRAHTAFAASNGALASWNDAGDSTTTHYHDGYPQLEVQRDAAAHVIAARANVEQDSLRWTPTGEHLDLTALREVWAKLRDQPATADLVHDVDWSDGPSGDAIHQRIVAAARIRIELRPSPAGAEQRAADERAAIAADYPSRRAAFVHAFEAQLAAMGATWEQLGIAEMRVGR